MSPQNPPLHNLHALLEDSGNSAIYQIAMHAEAIIQLFAILLGMIAIVVPIITYLKNVKRPGGRSANGSITSRRWISAVLGTVVLVTVGIVLWQPIPLHFSPQTCLILSVSGAVLYFPAVSLYLWGLVTLRAQFGVSSAVSAELYQDHKLITGGPFAIMRHPMYLGVLVSAIGALLIFRTWAMLLFAPMSLVVLARAEREEELLKEGFGKAWQTYADHVPKWIPRI